MQATQEEEGKKGRMKERRRKKGGLGPLTGGVSRGTGGGVQGRRCIKIGGGGLKNRINRINRINRG